MPNKLQNYLRTHRKKAGLTQDEMAFLLGCGGGAKVSRYEHFTRQPRLKTVFAYQVIFKISVDELFPGVFEEAERNTIRRAKLLIKRLEQTEPSLTVSRKIEVIRRIVNKEV